MLGYFYDRTTQDGPHAGEDIQREPETHSDDRALLEHELVTRNIKLAEGIASRYAGSIGDPRDIRQVALLGLVKASQRFDPERGFPFAAFAAPTIAGEIKRHLRDTGWVVRPPRQIQELALAVNSESPRLEHSLGHVPTPTELAEHLSVDPGALVEAMASTRGMFSASLDELGEPDAVAALRTQDPAEATATRLDVRQAMACLSERDQRIVAMRFAEGRPQREIAAVLDMSQMQVSRTITKALATLRYVLAPAS